MDFTTDELILDLKSRINSPTSDQAQNNDRYIRILTRTLLEELVPYYLSMQANHFLVGELINPDNGVFQIPQRAIGSKIKDINIVSADNESDVAHIDAGSRRIPGFYFQSDKIVLNPATFSSGPFRIWYYRRPGFLSLTSACGLVTDFDTMALTVTVKKAPSTWDTTTRLDFIKGNPGFQGIADGQVPTNVTGNVLTFSALPTGLAIGDWLAPEFSSPIPQIPVEGHGILAAKAATRILIAMGSAQLAGLARSKEKEITDSGEANASPRADNEPRKIVGINWDTSYRSPW